jgi:hypothetical protein
MWPLREATPKIIKRLSKERQHRKLENEYEYRNKTHVEGRALSLFLAIGQIITATGSFVPL